MKNAIFLCEASLEIGTGHVVRSLSLAKFLQKQGYNCAFSSSNKSRELISEINYFDSISLKSLLNCKINADFLIIDNYKLDEKFETSFKKRGVKIIVIDDLANRKHNCNILIDQNYGTKISDYQTLVNQDCKLLTGTNYAILRQEFLDLREKALTKRQNNQDIKKILVNFGGSDVNNHTLSALKTIENSNFIGEIEVVLGFESIHLNSIQYFSKRSRNKINIHHKANMAKLILECDIGLGAGGTSTWERCCLGLPTFIIKIADNQNKIFDAVGFKGTFQEFLNLAKENYQDLIAEIKDLVDGKGTSRIYKEIKKL